MIRKLLLLTLLPFLVAATSAVPNQQVQVYNFYLVSFEWETRIDPASNKSYSFWKVPYSYEGIIDLRSYNDRARFGNLNPTACCALMATVDDLLDSPNLTFITSSLSSTISNQTLTELSERLLISPLVSRDLTSLAHELLVSKADPTWNNFAKPVIPNRHGVVHANLGSIRLFTNALTPGSSDWNNSFAVLQMDYEEMVQRDKELALKYAGYWEGKYGLDIRTDKQKQRDGVVAKPETLHTEDFNCANNDSLNCDLTWTEVLADWDIVSNVATKTSNEHGTARADADVSGSDMYGEVDCNALGDFQWCGVVVRFSSSADTSYYYRFENDGVSNNIFSRTGGSDTLLIETGNNYCGAACADRTLRLEIEGSDLEAFWDDVSRATVTDSGITGNTRCGIYGFHATPNFDNFACEDLGTPPPVTRNRVIFIND